VTTPAGRFLFHVIGAMDEITDLAKTGDKELGQSGVE
jgi:hypothetical protein